MKRNFSIFAFTMTLLLSSSCLEPEEEGEDGGEGAGDLERDTAGIALLDSHAASGRQWPLWSGGWHVESQSSARGPRLAHGAECSNPNRPCHPLVITKNLRRAAEVSDAEIVLTFERENPGVYSVRVIRSTGAESVSGWQMCNTDFDFDSRTQPYSLFIPRGSWQGCDGSSPNDGQTIRIRFSPIQKIGYISDIFSRTARLGPSATGLHTGVDLAGKVRASGAARTVSVYSMQDSGSIDASRDDSVGIGTSASLFVYGHLLRSPSLSGLRSAERYTYLGQTDYGEFPQLHYMVAARGSKNTAGDLPAPAANPFRSGLLLEDPTPTKGVKGYGTIAFRPDDHPDPRIGSLAFPSDRPGIGQVDRSKGRWAVAGRIDIIARGGEPSIFDRSPVMGVGSAAYKVIGAGEEVLAGTLFDQTTFDGGISTTAGVVLNLNATEFNPNTPSVTKNTRTEDFNYYILTNNLDKAGGAAGLNAQGAWNTAQKRGDKALYPDDRYTVQAIFCSEFDDDDCSVPRDMQETVVVDNEPPRIIKQAALRDTLREAFAGRLELPVVFDQPMSTEDSVLPVVEVTYSNDTETWHEVASESATWTPDTNDTEIVLQLSWPDPTPHVVVQARITSAHGIGSLTHVVGDRELPEDEMEPLVIDLRRTCQSIYEEGLPDGYYLVTPGDQVVEAYCVEGWTVIDPAHEPRWEHYFDGFEILAGGLIRSSARSCSSWQDWFSLTTDSTRFAQSADCASLTVLDRVYHASGDLYGCTWWNRNCDFNGECHQCLDNFNRPDTPGTCPWLGEVGTWGDRATADTAYCHRCGADWWNRSPSLGNNGTHCIAYL